MSESAGQRGRIGLALGAVVLTAVVLVGGWFLFQILTGADDEGGGGSKAAPSSAPAEGGEGSSESPAAPAYKSACGLTGGDTKVPSNGMSGIEWAHENAWALPVSEEHGPGKRTEGGPWSCFSQTPSGAILAAYTIAMRSEGVAEDWEKVVKSQTVKDQGQEARLASGPPSHDNGVTHPRGFRVEHYSPESATIRYYLQDAGGTAVSCSVDVKWEKDDWKVKLQQDGTSVWGCTQGPPSDYTRWGPA